MCLNLVSVQMLAITIIILACIVVLIANAVLHAVQQAQEPREVDLKTSPDDQLRRIYRSVYIADVSLRDEAASKSDH